MKNDRDMDRLTDSLFGGDDQTFRETVLRASVQTSRARRRNRAIGRSALVASLALMAAIFLVRQRPTESPESSVTIPSSKVRLIESRPLPSAALVHSRAGTFVTVSTQSVPVDEIGDDQLLVMLRGKAIGLVREPGQPASLLLANTSASENSTAP